MVDKPVERPMIGAYWGPRAETAGECAARLRQCVEQLGEADPLFGEWFGGGWTPAEAYADPLADEDLASLTRRFEAGALRRDDTGEPLPSGGFVVTWWNGQEAAPARLRASVGIADELQVNAVVLELPTVVEVDWVYRPRGGGADPVGDPESVAADMGDLDHRLVAERPAADAVVAPQCGLADLPGRRPASSVGGRHHGGVGRWRLGPGHGYLYRGECGHAVGRADRTGGGW